MIEKDKVLVRRAYVEEYEAVMGIVWRTFLKFEAPDYSQEGIKSFQDFITDPVLHRMFILGEYQIFVAVCKGKIVGMISLRDRSHISLLFVDKQYHKQGIGRELVDYLKHYMQTELCEGKITVNASPYGLGFYHKLGFYDTDMEQVRQGVRFTPMISLL